MVKKIMVVFFGLFAVLIVLSIVFLSGKMKLLASPDGKTVYELRVHEGRLQHALRHGGVQLFSWSDIALEDVDGNALVPEKLEITRSNARTGEFEVAAFPRGVRLLVRVTDSYAAAAFYDFPAETSLRERVEVRPESGALGVQFSPESVEEGTDERKIARPFLFVAPKADGGDTFLVYHHTESAEQPRPRFVYDFAALAPVNFTAETVYEKGTPNGVLHVLYFSDSPVLLREIYDAGVPAEPFPTLGRAPENEGENDAR